ncbi:MAG: hypothetical protein L6R19_13790 [Alphaproteobacteria bacterium]|nr:hypothetical protein [Alphaproteobacteria bacterium]
MIPILMSVVGAMAGKLAVSAYEALTESSDQKAAEPQSGSVVKSNIGGDGLSPEATKVSVSTAGMQKNLASRYDPAKLSPARLEKLAGELKANGMVDAHEHALMVRVAAEARQTDAVSESGNRYLTSKNMIEEMDRRATQALKSGNQAEAAKYQKLVTVLKDISAQAPTTTNAAVKVA